jgi:hypothetical protein
MEAMSRRRARGVTPAREKRASTWRETRMRKQVQYTLVGLGVLFLVACGGPRPLRAPTADGNLLIGRCIAGVNNVGNSGIYEIYYGGIIVHVLSKQVENGEERLRMYELSTDGKGYFRMENVPDGEYAIKGARVAVGTGARLPLSSRLDSPNAPYTIQRDTDVIMADGEYFQTKVNNRIVDLGTHVFKLELGGEPAHFMQHKFDPILLVEGEEQVSSDYNHKYFLSLFPNSPWTPFLEQDLQRAQTQGVVQ